MNKQKTIKVKSHLRSKPSRFKSKLKTKKKITNKPKCIGCAVLLSTNTKIFAY